MKQVQILCVGRLKEKFFADALGEYAKRLGRFCDFSVKELPDYADGAQSEKRESEMLLKEADGYVVLADIGGKLLTSEQFSEVLCGAFITSPKVQMIIGGSHGVTDEVRARADVRVSFGRMTYPHQLMRVIAAEQLYHAFMIESGASYHK